MEQRYYSSQRLKLFQTKACDISRRSNQLDIKENFKDKYELERETMQLNISKTNMSQKERKKNSKDKYTIIE